MGINSAVHLELLLTKFLEFLFSALCTLHVVEFGMHQANKWLLLDENINHYNHSGKFWICGLAIKAKEAQGAVFLMN